jgi:hypothetical protein
MREAAEPPRSLENPRFSCESPADRKKATARKIFWVSASLRARLVLKMLQKVSYWRATHRQYPLSAPSVFGRPGFLVQGVCTSLWEWLSESMGVILKRGEMQGRCSKIRMREGVGRGTRNVVGAPAKLKSGSLRNCCFVALQEGLCLVDEPTRAFGSLCNRSTVPSRFGPTRPWRFRGCLRLQ